MSCRHVRTPRVLLALLLAAALPAIGAAQTAAPPPSTVSSEAPLSTSIAQNATSGLRYPFRGSVPTGVATSTPIALTLRDAMGRALTANLGAIESSEQVRTARAEWLTSLSRLLPNVTGQVSRTTQQLSADAFGFAAIPGLPVPRVIGPFSYVDARVSVSQSVFNWADIRSTQSARESRQASEHAYKASRELIVQATANTYLLVIADAALVEATRAQVETAKALHQQVSDQHDAGLAAGIDVLRARVELQTEQQRLIAAENQLSIDKLVLARVIGLPAGQAIEIADAAPFADLAPLTLPDALSRAYATRPDYQSARSRVRAAELAKNAATAGYYPSASIAVNYGAIGASFGRSNGTVMFVGSVAIPIFQGLTVQAQVLRSDAELRQVRAQFDDLTGAIDEQVRTALFNLTSASQLVTVARSNVDLATQTVAQARSRFQAGVADNLEVVQAQESLANANQSLISSLYSYNTAKVALAQSMGVAEESALTYLGVK